MSRLFCWLGWHAWYPPFWYEAHGYRWRVKFCRRCDERREFAMELVR